MGCILSASREQKSYFKYISHASAQHKDVAYNTALKLNDCNKVKILHKTHSSNNLTNVLK